jgi:hypothetical protein
MPQWNVKPDAERVGQVAAALVEHFPYEAELIVLDFLDGAAGRTDHSAALFWSMVHGLVEQMQMRLAYEPDYAPPLRHHAMM